MKLVKMLRTELGIIVVVDEKPDDDVLAEIRSDLESWAQINQDYPSPFLVVVGDQDTSYIDLRASAS